MSQLNLNVPNPETANPKDVIFFLTNWDRDVVKQAYTQLKGMSIRFPQEMEDLFRKKIAGQFLRRDQLYWSTSVQAYQEKKENLHQYSKTYSFELKGLQVDKYRERLMDAIIYDRVFLEKEPQNKYDHNAIKVTTGYGTIGYVPSNETSEVLEIIKGDHRSFIENISDFSDFLEGNVIIYYN